MATMSIFVSHAHEDNAFCRDLVQGLRAAGANVWYDEHNMESGQLMEVVQRELDRRDVFIVILTKHAFASKWVKRECTWAYEMADRDPKRIILPVTAGPIERVDFSGATGWLFLNDFKRIEAPGYQAFPLAEAINRTCHALALTPRGAAPEPVAAQPNESATDLVARAKALQAQQRYADAVPLLQRATQLAPQSFDAWFNLGYSLNELKRFPEALVAHDRAIAIDPKEKATWNNKGNALRDLQRYAEALAAYERALAIDPQFAFAWNGKGNALDDLKRYAEAIQCYERAIAIDPKIALIWQNMAYTLRRAGREAEAVQAEARAKALRG